MSSRRKADRRPYSGTSHPLGTFRNILTTNSKRWCTTCKPGASTTQGAQSAHPVVWGRIRMTDHRGWEQQPQYPERGQQYPQGQPWQPQHYDPRQHQQRFDHSPAVYQNQAVPRGYAQQFPPVAYQPHGVRAPCPCRSRNAARGTAGQLVPRERGTCSAVSSPHRRLQVALAAALSVGSGVAGRPADVSRRDAACPRGGAHRLAGPGFPERGVICPGTCVHFWD
jgi:hypothetical protein